MSWLRRFACWLFNLVPRLQLEYANERAIALGAENEALKLEIAEALLLNDPAAHVSMECYSRLEERYDVLYREHQVLKEKLDASDDEEKSQSARSH